MSIERRRRLRVLLDTNVFISYLLGSGTQSVVGQVILAAAEGRYALLLTSQLVSELTSAVAAKPYLASRIPPEQTDGLIAALSAVAELVPPIEPPIPAATRDTKDDYLLAAALLGAADYLVSGDRDLLVLGQVGDLRIVSPADFLRILGEPPERWGHDSSP